MSNTSQAPDRYAHALFTIQSLYDTYLAPSLPPPIASVVSTLLASAIRAQPLISQITSLFTSLISTIAGTSAGSAESTALFSTAVMIITLYISLRVFNYMRRMVMGWIIFAIKVVVVLVGVQVVWYVNQYGWDKAINDIGWWGGLIWGFVEEVLEGGKDGGAPRGTRSRASGAGSARRGGQYGYHAREQVPVGGRARWT